MNARTELTDVILVISIKRKSAMILIQMDAQNGLEINHARLAARTEHALAVT
jgi:hypothetical protein